MDEETYQPIIPLETVLSESMHRDTVGRPFVTEGHRQSRLVRLHPRVHGRSLEDETIRLKVLYMDEFKIPFGARSFKGLPTVAPEIAYDGSTPTHLRVQYYKDDLGAKESIEASVFLRRNGLPTERISVAHDVQEVRVGDKWITVKEWKQQQLANLEVIEEKLAAEYHRGHPKEERKCPVPRETLVNYIANLSLKVADRDYQTAERVRDLSLSLSRVIPSECFVIHDDRIEYLGESFPASEVEHIAKNHPSLKPEDIAELQRFLNENPKFEGVFSLGKEFKSRMQDIFKWIQIYETYSPNKVPKNFWSNLNADNPDDLRRYFCVYLPYKMGKYLAKLHKLNAWHDYAHGQNWSAVATLYDVDSVKAQELGDGECTVDNQRNDVAFTTYAISEIFSQHTAATQVSEYVHPYHGYLRQSLGREGHKLAFEEALEQFTASYLSERLGGKYNPDSAEQFFSDLFNPSGKRDNVDEVLQIYESKIFEEALAKMREKAS